MPNRNHRLLARWRAQLDDVDCTPLGFLDRVRTAVEDSSFPDVEIAAVMRREGSVFSHDRAYLRIRYHRLYFDVTAVVTGRILGVSFWLHKDPPGVLELFSEIPGVGGVLRHVFDRATYYRVDILETFQHMVNDAVRTVCDQVVDEARDHLLPDEDRQPVWHRIW